MGTFLYVMAVKWRTDGLKISPFKRAFAYNQNMQKSGESYGLYRFGAFVRVRVRMCVHWMKCDEKINKALSGRSVVSVH